MSRALFAYRGALYKDHSLPNRQVLFNELRERGVEPLVSVHAERAFNGGRVNAWSLSEETHRSRQRLVGRLGLHTDIQAIVNRANRSLRLENLPPMINENATRSLGHFKARTHREVLTPLGLDMPTRLVTVREDLDDFLFNHGDRQFVVKPHIGNMGKGVERVKRSSVSDLFAARPDWFGKYLLQPAYDFNLPLPATVQAYDKASQAQFEALSRADNPKEVRMYGFYIGGHTQLFPAARSREGQADNWFFLDPDSLPERLYAESEKAFDRAADISQAGAIYGTLDYGYGQRQGHDPAWVAIEMNLRTPYLVGADQHVEVAHRLRAMFADQIYMATQLSKNGLQSY